MRVDGFDFRLGELGNVGAVFVQEAFDCFFYASSYAIVDLFPSPLDGGVDIRWISCYVSCFSSFGSIPIPVDACQRPRLRFSYGF